MIPDATSASPIEFASKDGIVLRGQHMAGNDYWVILVHDAAYNGDLDCWWPLIPSLTSRGWSVLSIDLRGHGASGGDWHPDHAIGDLNSTLRYAKSRHPNAIGLVAAGLSATIALSYAGRLGVEAAALLSPRITADQPLDSLRGFGESRLFVCGGANSEMRRISERLRNASIGWAAILNLPTMDQGTKLLDGDLAVHAREHISSFLAEQFFLANRRVRHSSTPTCASADERQDAALTEERGENT